MKNESENVKPATDSVIPQRDGDLVSALVVREGGVELGFEGVKTHLPGVLKSVEMRFDRVRGSIMIYWSGRRPDGTHKLRRIGVPLSNVKQFELE